MRFRRSGSEPDPIEEPEPEAELELEPELERPRSRAVHAWRVLRGREQTNVQLAAEWLEYKLIFTDILTRFSAQLARNAKVEGKRIRKQLEGEASAPVEAPAPIGQRDKSDLRRRAAALKLGYQPTHPVQNGANP